MFWDFAFLLLVGVCVARQVLAEVLTARAEQQPDAALAVACKWLLVDQERRQLARPGDQFRGIEWWWGAILLLGLMFVVWVWRAYLR